MIFQNLAIVATFASAVMAQNIGDGTIPSQCQSLCADVLTISRNCLTQNNNNNQNSIQCICRAPNAGSLVSTCEACVSEYNTGGGDPEGTRPAGNDVLSILSSCSFTTTNYNRESASSVLRSVASSFASASGSVIRTTSGSVVLTTSVPASTRPASQTGAAPRQTAAAGAALGLVGIAVGLL